MVADAVAAAARPRRRRRRCRITARVHEGLHEVRRSTGRAARTRVGHPGRRHRARLPRSLARSTRAGGRRCERSVRARGPSNSSRVVLRRMTAGPSLVKPEGWRNVRGCRACR